MAKVRNVVGGFVVVALIAGFVRYVAWPDPELAGVVKVSSDGDGHVDGARYESETPTSGEHDASAPSCGTRSEQLDAPLAVHALEHGTVLVWYDSAQPDIGAELTELMSEWDSHVIVSPHSDLEAPIVATAWNRLKEYDEVEPEISEFISVYRNRGPEKVSCDY